MKYLYKYTPELILIIYIGLFLGFKGVDHNWDRVINSDGKGYYAYLPEIGRASCRERVCQYV